MMCTECAKWQRLTADGFVTEYALRQRLEFLEAVVKLREEQIEQLQRDRDNGIGKIAGQTI